MTGIGPRRNWVPNIEEMARQLVEDFRDERGAMESGSFSAPGHIAGEGDSDALSTLASWEQTAADHGEEITTDDLHVLILLLARGYVARALGRPDPLATLLRDDEGDD